MTAADTTVPLAPLSGTNRDTASKLAYSLLGPVIAQYLMRLDAHVRYATGTGARILFVSRAGVRIQRLYREFLALRKLSDPAEHALFWTSRCLTAKAVWNCMPDETMKLLGLQFFSNNLREVCAALLRPTGCADEALGCSDTELDASAAQLPQFLLSGHHLAVAVAEHLRVQGELFEIYLARLLGPARRAVLVDTGWESTIQNLLTRAFGQYEWQGVYFGKIPSTVQPAHGHSTGLIFEANRFDPDRPPTAFVLYRHLIESLFEPHGHSIEHLERHPEFGVWAPGSDPLLQETPTFDTDAVYCSVLAYLRDNISRQCLSELDSRGDSAMLSLGRLIAYPRRHEALALGELFSSMDFGRPVRVPALLQPGNPEQAEQRIRQALWAQGQITLEYPQRLVRMRQDSQLGLCAPTGELFPPPRARCGPVLPELQRDYAAVAVVVRTVKRPQFLRRALTSIGQQTFHDYICVVVCDGGYYDEVMFECARAAIDPRQLIVVDNKPSRGMEAASNIGIRQCSSEFIVIHDDDDSWEPAFLERTVAFLRDPQGTRYGGVVTWATRVSEIATPDGPVIRNRRPFMTYNALQLVELACGNLFPPIAFLYRRRIYEQLGGYNETLPVLGDWEFNLRFILEMDIGVIRNALANYHFRDLERDAVFGNSVITELDKCAEYDAVVRNALLRSTAANGRLEGLLIGLGALERFRSTRLRPDQEAGIRPSPILSVSPSSLSFGDQAAGTTSARRSITVTNPGTMSLTVNSVTLAGMNAPAFSIAGNQVATIAAGGSYAIGVAFNPPGTGAKSAEVIIATDSSDTPATVSLSGMGTAGS